MNTVQSKPENNETPRIDYLLSMRQVCNIVGVSRHTIYRMIDAGQFPAPGKLGLRHLGWRTSVIDAWLEQRFGKPGSRVIHDA